MKFAVFLLVLSMGSAQADANAGVEALAKASRLGNLKTAQGLLENGVDPNLSDQYGKMPLYYAASFNETKVVELLLASHADPNVGANGQEPSEFPVIPLQIAAYMGNLRIAEILIAAGARIDVEGAIGPTALHFAVRGIHLDVIHYFLEKGADPNIRDAEGTSPLDEAVWNGSLDMVAILLAHGARLNEAEPKTGATPINEAAYQGNTRVVQFLLQFHPDLDTRDKEGYSALENAARRGKEDSALLLLEAEAKRQKTTQSFEKTMDFALKKDEPALLDALLRHGAPIDDPLPSGLSSLDVAASAGAIKAAGVLLNNGADPNRTLPNGTSPLEEASLKGFGTIVGMLLDHRALVNQVNGGSGTTALYAAASFGKDAVVKLLLDRGAKPNLCGKNQKTPYQAALENGYHDLAAQIEMHGGTKRCER